MLGHKVVQRAATMMETIGASRTSSESLSAIVSKARARLVTGLDVTQPDTVKRILDEVLPDVVVNCVGVIKQKPGAHDAIQSIRINSLFPHELALRCAEGRARLIHLSTDCVFSGNRGRYSEADRPDPTDLYGHSKFLGELQAAGVLTIRTSMIGRELSAFGSLLEWFLGQPSGATVKGYKRAIFSGLTTIALADEIVRIIQRQPHLEGLFHLSAAPISKFDLLGIARDVFRLSRTIEPDSTFHCDRSLISDRYRSITGFSPASWQDMIGDVAADPTSYRPPA